MKREYVCAVCGQRCRSVHATLSRQEVINAGQPDEHKINISGRGLGTWDCTTHGKTKVKVKFV